MLTKIGLILIALSSTSSQQEARSQYPIEESTKTIVCHGTQVTSENGDFKDLADFCYNTIGVKCEPSPSSSQDQAPRYRLTFEHLFSPRRNAQNRLSFDYSLNGAEGALLDQPSYQHLQRFSEICAVKCYCAATEPWIHGLASTPQMESTRYSSFASFPTGLTVLEWSFDTDRTTLRRASTSDEIHTKAGSSEVGSGRDFYVGSNANRIQCRQVPWFSAIHFQPEVPSSLGWTSVQSMCAHRFYGGSIISNHGYVCILGPDLALHVRTKYERTNPLFVDDENNRSVVKSIASYWGKLCKTLCHCHSGETFPRLNNEYTELAEDLLFRGGGTDSESSSGLDSSEESDAGSATGASCLSRGCSKNADCGPDCHCLAFTASPPPSDRAELSSTRRKGFAASCGSLLSAASMSTFSGRLGRRVTLTEGREVWSGACLCNASYVSRACCKSRAEVIWEDEGYNVGEVSKTATKFQGPG